MAEVQLTKEDDDDDEKRKHKSVHMAWQRVGTKFCSFSTLTGSKTWRIFLNQFSTRAKYPAHKHWVHLVHLPYHQD